jgi:hypothetical protein
MAEVLELVYLCQKHFVQACLCSRLVRLKKNYVI